MSPHPPQEAMAVFFKELREKDFHLGLDPEFSTIQKLATAPPELCFSTLREHIDQFFFARGFPVLERLIKVGRETRPEAVPLLNSMAGVIEQFLADQFVAREGKTLPQPRMLREMMRRINEEGPDATREYVEQNIAYLDGYFFMTLSTAIRNARGAGHEPTAQVLIVLGRLVVRLRQAHGFPCSFGPLFWS